MSGALKTYAIAGVALGGWFVGRMPAMVDEYAAERAGLFPAARAATPPRPAEPFDAARIAAEAARATVAELIAAGWRPPGAPAAAPSAPAAPAIIERVRVVTAAAPSAPAWSLPPVGFPDAPALPPPAPARQAMAAKPAENRAAWAAADAAYAALRRGDRRAAAAAFAEAITLEGDTPRARPWVAEYRRLTDRFSGEAFTVTRPGPGSAVAASPVLGGGQVGGTISFTPNPLARQPISVIARLSAGQDASGKLDTDAAEGAIGVRWRPIPAVALDAERRFAVGAFGKAGWGVRASGGVAGETRLAGVGVRADVYGEAGVVWRPGAAVTYGGAQAWAGGRALRLGSITLDAGAGAWAAGQRGGGASLGRVDAGPSVRLTGGRLPFDVQADYRAKLAGNTSPGSGPVVTVSGRF